MDACTDPAIERITLKKSARVGYTKILNHLVAYHIHQDPAPILVVQPTIEDAQGWSKDELAPALRDTPVLAELVGENKTRESGNTILKKSYPGGTLSVTGANSARGFRRLTVRLVLFDEVDGYPPSAGDEGDQIALGVRRTDTFWNRKIVIGSTPTVKGISRVDKSFEESDQRYYYVPCPHCGHQHRLEWKNLQWPEGEPEKAYFVCPENGCVIEHEHKQWMVENGEWRATKPSRGHAGFHIWAAYSYSPNAAWGKLAAEFLHAKDDPLQLKTFVNTVLGETWEEQTEKVEHEPLMERREAYVAQVPAGAYVLTCAVDVQKDRLELEVVGWGTLEESWGVERRTIWGDPTDPAVWRDLDALRESEYVHESGTKLRIAATCIDSGYLQNMVFDYCRKRRGQRLWPTKGLPGEGKPIAPRPKNQRLAQDFRGVDVVNVGTFEAKHLVYTRLQKTEPGPGYCHFPAEYEQEFFLQLTAERLVTTFERGVQKREFRNIRRRNEALDIRVLNLVAVHLLNPSWGALARQFNWEAPVEEKKAAPPVTPVKQAVRTRVRPRRRSYVRGWNS